MPPRRSAPAGPPAATAVGPRARPARRYALAGDTPVNPARHLVLHVRLPDRPGALGAVASRIGAVGADITDVAVARRDRDSAVDVFHLTLPEARVDVLALLCTEVREVDGASVERWVSADCCGPGA